MSLQPTNLALRQGVLSIEWSDGLTLEYDVVRLRQHCPCATCRTDRVRTTGDENEPLPANPDVTIKSMEPVGNYAYKITFSDGHDTGLFTLDLLRELGRPS